MTAVRLAALLEARIRDGSLPPGAQLPTHRDLAHEHGLAVNTATRAMRLLAQRGLVSGEVGRGTFVLAAGHRDAASLRIELGEAGMIDLGGNVMPLPGLAERFERAARTVLRRGREALSDYQPHAGRAEDRAAGAAWMSRDGHLPNDPGRTIITAGAQHAALLALLATTRPGDAVAVEALTWPGMKAAAAALRLDLLPVALDAGGMRPRDLLSVAARRRIAAVYLTPTIQNPTSAVLSVRRREAITMIARRLDFAILEDDAYGFLAGPQAPPPLASLAPERTWYMRSTSKALTPGLRAGWLLVPPGKERVAADLARATIWTAQPLGAAIASLWVADGTAASLEAEKRIEASARQLMAEQALPQSWRRRTYPRSMHLWLDLPGKLRAADAVRLAATEGVRILPGEAFAITAAPNAIRLALGRPMHREDLAEALRRLATALMR